VHRIKWILSGRSAVEWQQVLQGEQILWSEGPWLGEELGKSWENYYEIQGYSPFAKTSVC